jgi:hypothetical protein
MHKARRQCTHQQRQARQAYSNGMGETHDRISRLSRLSSRGQHHVTAVIWS